MGEIAEDMIDGCCCSMCGQYFVSKKDDSEMFEHGHPVACVECWEPDCGYQKQSKKAKIL